MTFEQDQNFEADRNRQQVEVMLGSIMNAVGEEDYEFAAETALGQDLISPADVVEYVHLQGKGEEDPVAQRRTIDGVTSIVASLRERDQSEVAEGKERSLTNDEVERINRVMRDIELQEMAENEVLAEEPDVSDGSDYVRPDYEWDSDVFSPDLSDYTDEEIEKVRNMVGFKAALKKAENTGIEASSRLKAARDMIEQNSGRYKTLQLLLLDEAIYEAAEYKAENTGIEASSRLQAARSLLEDYASDHDAEERLVTARMLASLDKHVARAAKAKAENTGIEASSRLQAARSLIENYASSPERAQAMLDELGL